MSRPWRLGRVLPAAGAAALGALATSASEPGRAQPPHRAIAVEAGALTLRAVRAGSGPTVLLLHGYGESLLSWQNVFDRLEGEADVVALDLPGFGLSSKPSSGYAIDSLAATVLRAMDALHIGQAVLVGHSLGGAIAAAAAVAEPERVRGLVLVDPAVVGGRWVGGTGAASDATRRVVGRGVAEYEALRLRFVGVHDPTWLAESDSALAYLPSADTAYVVALQAVLREFDFSYLTAERAARLRMPILLLWGAYDRTVPVDLGRSLARALPTSEFHVIGRSWHRPHVERPAEVAGLIFGFLRSLPGSKEPEGH